MASNDTQAMDKLKNVGQDLLKAAGEKAVQSVTGKVGDLTDRFDGIANGGPIGKSKSKDDEEPDKDESEEGDDQGDDESDGVMGKLKGAASSVKDKLTPGGGGGGKGGASKPTKAINIIEDIDVGVPIRVAYNQWTTYGDFPSFMKKMEDANLTDGDEGEEVKVDFKVQIFLSHRRWESKITRQVPDERIVWTSKGDKGHVDGSVSFHELGPNLTRILVVLEYYPQGPFEWVGNRWRAQGRRARLEIKNFRRHVMTRSILDPDEIEGWRGTIEDGKVVTTHDEAIEQEQDEQDDQYDDYEGDESEDEESEEPEEDEDEDESEEDEADDEYEEEEAEDDESEEDEEESKPRRRRAS